MLSGLVYKNTSSLWRSIGQCCNVRLVRKLKHKAMLWWCHRARMLILLRETSLRIAYVVVSACKVRWEKISLLSFAFALVMYLCWVICVHFNHPVYLRLCVIPGNKSLQAWLTQEVWKELVSSSFLMLAHSPTCYLKPQSLGRLSDEYICIF